jgi:hypothetical protein
LAHIGELLVTAQFLELLFESSYFEPCVSFAFGIEFIDLIQSVNETRPQSDGNVTLSISWSKAVKNASSLAPRPASKSSTFVGARGEYAESSGTTSAVRSRNIADAPVLTSS